MPEPIHIAICADKNIEVGLHVTLYSLLESTHHPIKIYFVQKGYDKDSIHKIYETLKPYNGLYELVIIEFDEQIFAHCRGVYGNKFAFARIMLANLIQYDRVIYLDSDLLIKKDLYNLFHSDLRGYAIGVAGIGSIEWALERDFLISLNLKPSAKYFNSGVLLLDLNLWRNRNLIQLCFDFATQYGNMLPSADQTILNYVFYENNFMILDPSYNRIVYPHSPAIPLDRLDNIFHFVGSPKPWDFLGELFHNNYLLFHSVLKKTYFKNYKTYFDISCSRFQRTCRLLRAYYSCFVKRST